MNLHRFMILALLQAGLFSLSSASAEESTAAAEFGTANLTRIDLTGIGLDTGVMRRDPSDIIKVGDLYYLWYSKGQISTGYDATIWYASSPDGINWTEQGEALTKGETGSWEGASVFTPNILIAEGRYWLFYTGTSRPYTKKSFSPDSKIGVAVANSPDGPWERVSDQPVLKNSSDPTQFDSHLIDDACLIVRNGKYWIYYKGRQLGEGPAETKMGVAIAEHPAGPYVKYKNNPVIPGNHEVVVWPQGTGVAAMIGERAPEALQNSVVYSEDGFNFSKTHDVKDHPWAAGTYRPEAFTDSNLGEPVKWGVEIGNAPGRALPFIRRFNIDWSESSMCCLSRRR
jgi:beta-xylosidase